MEQGICSEGLWPYDTSKYRTPPPEQCFTEALKTHITGCATVAKTVGAIKATLEQHATPVLMGFRVYSSFDTIGATGLMPVPAVQTETELGGHCVAIVGWDDEKSGFAGTTRGAFKVRNSWGLGWGELGHFWMPYECAMAPYSSSY